MSPPPSGRTPPPPPPGPLQEDHLESVGRDRTRKGQRRALAWGLGLSALGHLLVVILYPGLLDRVPEVRVSPAPTPSELRVEGIEIITFRDVEEDPAPTEEAPPPEVVVELPDPVEAESPVALPLPAPPPLPTPTGEGVRATERDDRQRAAAELLRPQMGDPRLWAPVDRSLVDLSDAELAEVYLRGMIRDWNDSVAVAVALSGDATDWTYTDDEGRRWGLSPGRLHLGDFSIPLPLSFDLPQARRNDQMARNWEIQDILRGVASAEVRQSWAERAREIRERMEAQRARGGGDGGTVAGQGSGGSGGGGGSGSGGGEPPGN